MSISRITTRERLSPRLESRGRILDHPGGYKLVVKAMHKYATSRAAPVGLPPFEIGFEVVVCACVPSNCKSLPVALSVALLLLPTQLSRPRLQMPARPSKC